MPLAVPLSVVIDGRVRNFSAAGYVSDQSRTQPIKRKPKRALAFRLMFDRSPRRLKEATPMPFETIITSRHQEMRRT